MRMTTMTIIGLGIVLLLVLGSEFVNGWTDAPNAIATLVATRVMTTRQAIAMAVCMNILGTLSGTAVAETMGKGIVNPASINLLTISAALIALIAWGSIAAQFGIPTSESHALVAGLTGAAIATSGWKSLEWGGWTKVGIGIVCALFIGSAVTWLLSRVIIVMCGNWRPARTKKFFDRAQILAGVAMAFSHGMNDGQKFVGVFTLSLVMGGVLPAFHIPIWVIFLCAITMGIGTMLGGKEIIGTLGEKIAKIESWQGFASMLGSSLTIIGASATGIPLSTTHTTVASVAGAGASRSVAHVRWQYPRQILIASIVTFPLCGTVAWATCMLLQGVQHLLGY